MILRLKYDEVKGSGARGEVNGKAVNFFMRVEVNETNIIKALDDFRGNKWIVAFDYTGDLDYLKSLELGNRVVIVTKEIDNVDINIDFTMGEIGSTIRVVFKLPDSYTDMRSIYDYSKKYSNIRFCGGKLLRLEGCNIGCIGVDDVFKKVADSRLSIVAEGCACVFPNTELDNVDMLEFYDAKLAQPKDKSASGTKTKKPKAPSKRLSSLVALTNSGGLDNF